MYKIMVVDDCELQRDSLSMILAKAGYEVTATSDGIEALQTLSRQDDFDLIISDYWMKNMNGMVLRDQIKQHFAHVTAPMIMVTSNKDMTLRARMRQSGYDFFLQKPVHPQKLSQVVNALIARHREKLAEQFQEDEKTEPNFQPDAS